MSELSKRASDIDLERVATSTLGRQHEVVAVFLDLVDKVGTPQALFVAQAAYRLRSESDLRARAEAIILRLKAEPGEHADARATLYSLLSQPLGERRRIWEAHLSSPDPRLQVDEALRAEDERLQRLSKERSYRSGSYLHFLRHALADLVLVAGVDGVLGRRAFALLQRRVEEAEEQEELVALLDEKTRRRYLRWAIDLKNAGPHQRTSFALRMLRERFPGDADSDALALLVRRGEPDVAVDAAITALALGLEERDFPAEFARLVNELDEKKARRLVRALVATRPQLARLDLISADRRRLFFEEAAANPGQFLDRVVDSLERIGDQDELVDIFASMEKLGTNVALPDETFARALRQLLGLASGDRRFWHVVDRALDGERSRTAAWAVLPHLNESVRRELGHMVIGKEHRSRRAGLATSTLEAVPNDAREAFAELVLEELLRGQLDPSEIAGRWPADLSRFAVERLGARRELAERETADVRARLELGEDAHVLELRGRVQPLIERAIDRAQGNERLAAGYKRLVETLDSQRGEAVVADAPSAALDDIAEELGRFGSKLERDDEGIRIALDGAPSSEAASIRYLGALDQRVRTPGTAPDVKAASAEVLKALVEALGASGAAERAVVDLFQRGPLFPIGVQLSGTTRKLLLEAAQSNGLAVPGAWFEHPALGEWLRTIQLQDVMPADDADLDVPTLATAFRLAQDAELALQSARRELEEQQHTVKQSFGRDASNVLDEVAVLFDSYMQLWHGLAGLGLRQAAPLGTVVPQVALDPKRHEVVSGAECDEFVVRAPGLEVDGEVLVRARVEGVVT